MHVLTTPAREESPGYPCKAAFNAMNNASGFTTVAMLRLRFRRRRERLRLRLACMAMRSKGQGTLRMVIVRLIGLCRASCTKPYRACGMVTNYQKAPRALGKPYHSRIDDLHLLVTLTHQKPEASLGKSPKMTATTLPSIGTAPDADLQQHRP